MLEFKFNTGSLKYKKYIVYKTQKESLLVTVAYQEILPALAQS